jgi:hypothetical protein
MNIGFVSSVDLANTKRGIEDERAHLRNAMKRASSVGSFAKSSDAEVPANVQLSRHTTSRSIVTRGL